MTASLVLGSLPLVPPAGNVDAQLRDGSLAFVLEATADGTNWGNPEAVVTAIESQLQDGSLAEVSSQGNRSATVGVRVRSLTYPGLAAGEAALKIAAEDFPGYSTLTWTPDAEMAEPSVFDVVYGVMGFSFNDLSEVKRHPSELLSRQYSLTLECLPFARDVDKTSVVAVPTSTGGNPQTPPVATSINDCSSSAGWENTAGPVAPVSDGSVIRVPMSTMTGIQTANVGRRNVNITLAAGPFFFWEWQQNSSNAPFMAIINAAGQYTQVPIVHTTAATRQGFTRTYFRVPDQAFPLSGIGFGGMVSDSSADFLYVDQVSQSTSLPGAGAAGARRQKTQTIEVGGSARTPAKLVMSAADNATGSGLGGSTIIYTRKAGSAFQPPLRPWGGPPETIDDSTISGGYSNGLQALIPANLLLTGTYNLLARVAGSGLVSYSVKMVVKDPANGNYSDAYNGARTAVSGEVAFGTGVGVLDFGLFTLPPFGVSPGSSYYVQVNVGGANVMVDEGWLFDVDRGVLSLFESLGLESVETLTPDLSMPEPSYWGTYRQNFGPESRQRVRIDSRVLAGEHYFEPGLVDVFGACFSDVWSVSAEYYRRHHTHVTAA